MRYIYIFVLAFLYTGCAGTNYFYVNDYSAWLCEQPECNRDDSVALLSPGIKLELSEERKATTATAFFDVGEGSCFFSRIIHRVKYKHNNQAQEYWVNSSNPRLLLHQMTFKFPVTYSSSHGTWGDVKVTKNADRFFSVQAQCKKIWDDVLSSGKMISTYKIGN